MATYQALNCSIDDGVATIVLNRPKRMNALDLVLRAELADALFEIQRDPAVRALILTGAGGNFCSGGDISTMGGDATASARRQRMLDLHPLVAALLQLDRPLIVAVPGVAFGAGCGMALAGDFILATPGTRFCLSFARVGLVPDFGSAYTLPRIVGLQRAKELIFSAREFGAEEARRLGIVYEIHAADVLMARARELAASFNGASATALGIAKRALNASLHSDLQTMLMHEADGQGIAFSTDYHQEAVQRFQAKQPPQFMWPAKREA